MPASAAPDAGSKVKKGQPGKKIGAGRNGFLCKNVKGKLVWSTRTRSSSPTVYPDWGSVTLEPFTVPVSGCKLIELTVELDEPAKMQDFGMQAFILESLTSRAIAVSGNHWSKSAFRWPATTAKMRVCATDWMEDSITLRRGIKPKTDYIFSVRTSGAIGGPRPYDNDAWFETGE